MTVKEARKIVQEFNENKRVTDEDEFMFIEAMNFLIEEEKNPKKKLGYVPEKDNIVFARLMDAGKLLKAKITQINQKGVLQTDKCGIYLVDF
ncbi:MAG: hypothetical protein IJ683_01080 [Butyrivibrio sp.]|nr:hypothetical protein [Butyrivibrio sp.]MBR1640913.1 hypothetical protein [Butyrivibrio sp.]